MMADRCRACRWDFFFFGIGGGGGGCKVVHGKSTGLGAVLLSLQLTTVKGCYKKPLGQEGVCIFMAACT